MSLVTANGLGVVAADWVLPISRAWHVVMTIATADPTQVNGKVAISINGGALTMNGTAEVDDVYLDTVRCRVVAGAAGLAKQATPKSYQQVTARIILSDLLQTAGETLSNTADTGVLGVQLANWTVLRMPVADAIGLLMGAVGASWRMLADGTMWCGQESWPDSGLAYSVEQVDKAHQQMIVTLESPLLLPGTSLGGQKVNYVETHVDAQTVRSIAWLQPSAGGDRLRDPFVGMARGALPGFDYRAPYRCKVVAQSGDLASVDLVPDDARLPSTGFKAVPLRHGLPGCKVQVGAGVFVLLSWMGGDPQKPFCSLWEGGESVTSWAFGSAPDPVLTKADMTALILTLTNAKCAAPGSPLTWTPPTSFSSNSFSVQR